MAGLDMAETTIVLVSLLGEWLMTPFLSMVNYRSVVTIIKVLILKFGEEAGDGEHAREAGADAGACSGEVSVAASPIIASHVSSVDVVGAAVLNSGGTVACSVPLAA